MVQHIERVGSIRSLGRGRPLRRVFIRTLSVNQKIHDTVVTVALASGNHTAMTACTE